MAAVLIIGDVAMSLLFSKSGTQTDSLIGLAVGFPVMLLAGHIAASVRPGAVIGLGAISAALGITSLLVTPDASPLAFQIVLLVLGPAGAILGGKLRLLRPQHH
jgi:hypothetical protein